MADQAIDDPNQNVKRRGRTHEWGEQRAQQEVREATGNVWTYQSLSGMLLGVLAFMLLCYMCVYHGNDVKTQRGLKAAIPAAPQFRLAAGDSHQIDIKLVPGREEQWVTYSLTRHMTKYDEFTFKMESQAKVAFTLTPVYGPDKTSIIWEVSVFKAGSTITFSTKSEKIVQTNSEDTMKLPSNIYVMTIDIYWGQIIISKGHEAAVGGMLKHHTAGALKRKGLFFDVIRQVLDYYPAGSKFSKEGLQSIFTKDVKLRDNDKIASISGRGLSGRVKIVPMPPGCVRMKFTEFNMENGDFRILVVGDDLIYIDQHGQIWKRAQRVQPPIRVGDIGRFQTGDDLTIKYEEKADSGGAILIFELDMSGDPHSKISAELKLQQNKGVTFQASCDNCDGTLTISLLQPM